MATPPSSRITTFVPALTTIRRAAASLRRAARPALAPPGPVTASPPAETAVPRLEAVGPEAELRRGPARSEEGGGAAGSRRRPLVVVSRPGQRDRAGFALPDVIPAEQGEIHGGPPFSGGRGSVLQLEKADDDPSGRVFLHAEEAL